MKNNFECKYISVGGTFCYCYDQDIGLNDLECSSCEMSDDCNYCSWSNLSKYEHLCSICKLNDKHCTKCKDYMQCNYNQIGLGSGNWAKECADYMES